MSQTSIMLYSEMGLLKLPLVVLLCSVFSLLSFIALCDASELTVKFLKTPHAFSNLNSTTFVFEVLVDGSGACTNCNITCKLDDGFGRINASQCENGTVLCERLQDGNHKFEVCPNGTQGVGCSSYNWTVDRRSINFTTHVPKRQLQFNGETILVRATNNYKKLRVCLTFPEPVLNTSEEIKHSLKVEILYSLPKSQGSLLSLVGTKKYEGPRRFQYKVDTYLFDTTVVNVSIDTNSIISRQGTSVSPVEPFAFIYDSLRPAVTLSTPPSESSRPAVMLRTLSRNWTRERSIPVLIKFMKPVFNFSHSNISITGGKLQSFEEVRNHIYIVVIKADQDIVSVSVPENVTGDAAGNKNEPSNVLQVMHHSVPKISNAFYGSITGSFVVIITAAGLLTVSIASLNSIGESSSRYPSPSQSESNLFRIACHLQVIALSGWLAVRLPVEYYELTRGLRWSIPYLSLPWERETGHTRLVMGNSSLPVNIHASIKPLLALIGKDHESPAGTEHLESALDPSILDGWRAFGRNMFWLAIIGGGLISVHALLLLILKLKKKNSEEQRDSGALTSPRFEIIIVNLGLTSVCQASAAIIRGGTASGIAVGVLLLGVVSFLLLALLLFLTIGITFATLLQYEEVHQEGQGFCCQKIVRLFLVSVEGDPWRPKKQYVTILGSLYEDYRGPPKSKLSQISGGSSHTQAEARFIQKLFGKLRIYYILLESVIQKLCGELRIYYPLLESVRRVLLAIMAGFYEDNSSSKIPTTFSLCINCFHLFFLVLEKPFTKKNIQLLEITAISSEACISAIIFVLGKKELSDKDEKELSDKDEKKFGILMLILVLVGILPQILNELYDLYKQIKQLDHFLLTGLKRALSGLTLLFSSKEFSLSRPPALKDNIADSNSKPTSVADEDTATSTSISNQVKSPNQD